MCAPNQYILVIDDDEAIREALGEVLSDLGHRAICAANGREAFDVLKQAQPPSLILLDLMMPVMDGWAFREQQRQDTALAQIPLFVLTAAGRHVRPLPVENDYVLTKPIGLDRLASVIDRYCQRAA